jgi:bacterioferritin (cytochrome b1)
VAIQPRNSVKLLKRCSLAVSCSLAIWQSGNQQQLYKDLLETVADKSVYLEEFARGMIGQEEMHGMELKKMLRDFSPANAV